VTDAPRVSNERLISLRKQWRYQAYGESRDENDDKAAQWAELADIADELLALRTPNEHGSALAQEAGMSEPYGIHILRRDTGRALEPRKGMTVGMPKVVIDASHAAHALAAYDAKCAEVAELTSRLASALSFVPDHVLCGDLQRAAKRYAAQSQADLIPTDRIVAGLTALEGAINSDNWNGEAAWIRRAQRRLTGEDGYALPPSQPGGKV
jgi:hypothetical protein